MSNDTPTRRHRRRRRRTAPRCRAGGEPHLFDRLSVLYKYRWAAIAVFMLVVGWVMVDSYTRIPVYRAHGARARSKIRTPTSPRRPKSRATSRSPIPRSTCRRSCASCAAATSRSASPRSSTCSKVAEFNGQGPKPTQLAVGIALVKYYAAWPYRLITSTQAEAPATVASFDPVDASRAIPTALLARLDVAQVRGSQLVDMTFDSADPRVRGAAPPTRSPTSTSRTTSRSRWRRSRRAPSG